MAADNSFQESRDKFIFGQTDSETEFMINRQVSQKKVMLLAGSTR